MSQVYVVELSPSGQDETKKAASGKENWNLTMTFTGTLIEDLIATVERAEANTREFETAEIEPWFASIQESMNYESKLLGVA